MRFDLEMNIVGQLTQNGLNKISNILYDSDNKIDGYINPATWDLKTLVSDGLENVGNISLDKYNFLKEVTPIVYRSGVLNDNNLIFNKYLIRDNIITPLFYGGFAYLHNYLFPWSNNVITKTLSISNNIYSYTLDNDVDIYSIEVYTLRLKYPGYVTYNKKYVYVDPVYNKDKTINLKLTWKSSKEDYKFTVSDENNRKILYANTDIIKYENMNYGTVQPGTVKSYGIPEFPVKDLKSIDSTGTDISNSVKEFTSIIRAKNETTSPMNVTSSWTVTPIVSYSQTSRQDNIDIVYKNINMLPNSLMFKDGMLCLHNMYGSPGGTIFSDNGSVILFPFSIELTSDKDSLSQYDSVKLTARVLSADEIPVKGANVKFNILTTDSKFVESGSDTFESITGIDGSAYSSIIVNKNKTGWYVQKEWITNDTITLPFDIRTDNINEFYTFIVTNDDPVLGKLFPRIDNTNYKPSLNDRTLRDALNRDEAPLIEVYSRPKSLDTYKISGRKIAYVELKQDSLSNKLTSKFIKPISIERHKTARIRFRDLYIQSTFESIMTHDNIPETLTLSQDPPDDYPLTITGHKSGTIPKRSGLTSDALSVYKAEVYDATIIKFAEPLPDNVRLAGLWIITGASGSIEVNATLTDKSNSISLVSNTLKIPIINFIKSEYSFILSDTRVPGYNTTIDPFSYFTVSEYLDNPFKLNSCTYSCIYSDCINKKCMNKNIDGQQYYILDSQGITCVHTPEYDNTLPLERRCPAVEARYVNPFVMFQNNN